jgi:ubiquitin conjugation factor E4 B
MADNEQPLSDADKIRLKRLAKLGGPSTPAPSTPTPQSVPTSDEPPSRQVQSGVSRLLNNIPSTSTPTAKASSSKEAARTPTLPRARKPSPPAPASKDTPIRKPPAPARLSVPYPEWEAQKVQEIFSVTLSVSLEIERL